MVEPHEPLELRGVLAALSIGTDLANDAPSGSALRSALFGLVVAEHMGLPPETRVDVFYTSLMRFLGCTAYSHEASVALGGDDREIHSAFAAVEMTRPGEVMRAMLTGLGRDKGVRGRVRAIAGAMRGGRAMFVDLARTQCEVAGRMSERLHMNAEIQLALTQIYERWDGAGVPLQLSGKNISIVARIVQVARAAELFLREEEGRADERLRERAGAAYDPEVVDACIACLPEIVVLGRDPSPCSLATARVPSTECSQVSIEEIALIFADYADLKSVYRIGHSHAVAALADGAGRLLGLDETELQQLRYAALLHDLGMVTVPTGILDNPRPLSMMEQEKIRLHPYYAARVLSLSPLASIAKIVGGHHERSDASGYPAGMPGNALPVMTRVLAAADVYRALMERRPQRDALTVTEAEAVLDQEVTAGRLDRAAVGAVLRAAGHVPRRTSDVPSPLSGREIEVLRSVAIGQSDKEIASQLGISPRTVHHHVGRIYRKIGVASRAAAALYAVEKGLLPFN